MKCWRDLIQCYGEIVQLEHWQTQQPAGAVSAKADSDCSRGTSGSNQKRTSNLSNEEDFRLQLPFTLVVLFKGNSKGDNEFRTPIGNYRLSAHSWRPIFQHPITTNEIARCGT